jgi:hypothetical protein
MNWLSIVALVLQYGPGLFQALAALIGAIRSKNVGAGSDAVTQANAIALRVVLSLKARNDMTDAEKREQAWKDVQFGARSIGVTLSESESRTLAELAYQDAKPKPL